METVPLYIMAGGQSRRFGSDKARALYQGAPLLQHVADALAPIASSKPVVVAQQVDQYEDLGFATIADKEPQLGPIGGLLTALSHRKESHDDGWCAVASCDVIGLQASWMQQLLDARAERLQAVAFGKEPWDPLFAVYHTDLLPLIEQRVKASQRSMWRLLEAADALALPHPHDWHEVTQINTKEALASLSGS